MTWVDRTMTRDRDERRANDSATRHWVSADLRRRYTPVLAETLPQEWLDMLPPSAAPARKG